MSRLNYLVLVGMLAASALHGASILVTPATQNTTSGAQFVVDLQISGLGNGTAPSVGTFDLDLGFDPLLLSFVDATYGTGLDVLGLGSLQFTTPGTGTVNLFELSFDSASDLNTLQPASFMLATLTFEALADGTSPLTINLNALGDADGASLAATLTNGSVTIGAPSSAIPEPSTFTLAALALGGLAVQRFRRA